MAATTVGRAFTKRQKQQRPEVSAPMPLQQHEGTTKFTSGTIKRSKISGPVDLVSSTNLIAYTSPDLPSSSQKKTAATRPKPPSASSSSSSLRSGGGDDSDLGPRCSTPVTSPGLPSQDTSPVSTEAKKSQLQHHSHHGHTHSSSHSRPKTNGSTHSRSSTSTSHSSSSQATPPIPHRSLSHTKKSHQDLSQKRSFSRETPPPTSISSTHASRVSHEQQPDAHHQQHPFGKELEQVKEVAEEFRTHMSSERDEELDLRSKGYRKFTVEDYILEIQDLYRMIFHEELCPPAQAWI